MQTDFLSTAVNAAAAPLAGSAAGLPGTPASGLAAPGAGGSAPFSGLLQDAVANLQGLEEQASSSVEGLVAGRGVDIHAAMIATQKSDLAFEMALAVRGKMVSAYQTLMGVQF